MIHKNIRTRLLHKAEEQQESKAELPFNDIIESLNDHRSPASTTSDSPVPATSFKDLSVHLCFICLLHLANEHGLTLCNHGQLDKLSVSSMQEH